MATRPKAPVCGGQLRADTRLALTGVLLAQGGMEFDFTPLAKAVGRLDEGLARYNEDRNDLQIRDGLVQRFEFTYELAHKMLRRALEQSSPSPDEIDRMSFPTLIRTAYEQGFVASSWPIWSDFRDMRNIASHTYDEAKAMRVVQAIPAFLAEARFLLTQLTDRPQ